MQSIKYILIFVIIGVMMGLVSSASPTITNSYGNSKWDTTTAKLNCDFLDTGSTLTEYLSTGAKGLGDAGQWTRYGDAYVAYDYLGFWDSSEDFASPRAYGNATPVSLTSSLVNGATYKMSYFVDTSCTSENINVTVCGNTFSYSPGIYEFVEETFTCSGTDKPVFISPADAVGDGSGSCNYAGFTFPLSLTNVGSTSGNITLFWGDNDGETTKANWDNEVFLEEKNIASRLYPLYGKVNTTITGLTSGSQYYYRCYVNNSNGEDWANETRNWTQLNNAKDIIPIYDIENLQALRDNLTQSAQLMNNINASKTLTWNAKYSGATPLYSGFIRISNGTLQGDDGAYDFRGNLSGNGYAITDLMIYDRENNGASGIFWQFYGTAKDILFINPNVTCGGGNCGTLAGIAMTGSNLSNIGVINPKVNGTAGIWVGTIAGQATNVYNCYSYGGTATSTSVYIGMFGQVNSGYLQNSYSSTNFSNFASSGMVGQNYARINNSFAVGKSTGSQSGSLTGYNYDLQINNENNYWYNNSAFSTSAYGNCNNLGACNNSTTQVFDLNTLKNTKTFGLFNYWDFENIWRETPNDYPRLYFEYPQISLITENNSLFQSNIVTINYTANSTVYNLINCSYSIDGGSYTNNSCNNLSLSGLSNGNHIIDISAINSNGYIYNKTIYLIKDNRSINIDYIGLNITAPRNPFLMLFNITCFGSNCNQINFTLYEKSYQNNESNTSFESANDVTENYQDVSNAFSYTTTTPYQGTYAIFTEGSRNNVLFQKIQGIDVSKYSSCTISAWMKGTTQIDNGEGICLDYSNNNGSTWNTGTTFSQTLCITNGNDNNVYQLKSYTFTPTSTTIFKWRFRAKTSDSTEKVWADNVVFNCTYTGGLLNNTRFQMNSSNPSNFSLNENQSNLISFLINPLVQVNTTIYANVSLQNNYLINNLSSEINVFTYCWLNNSNRIIIPPTCRYIQNSIGSLF